MSHSNPIADRQLALLAKIDLLELHKKAMAAAVTAAKAENDRLPPENSRGFDCGFAWVHAPDVRLNTKEGKNLLGLGWRKHWKRGAELWNPAAQPTQSISVHYAGAVAYVEAMKDSGIKMYAGQRYD